jgi:hypothetical protein
MVTHSQANFGYGYTSLQALVQAQGIRGWGREGEGEGSSCYNTISLSIDDSLSSHISVPKCHLHEATTTIMAARRARRGHTQLMK